MRNATGRSKWAPFLLFPLGLVFNATQLAAEPASSGEYNLFNPTPVGLLRDFNTDRPSITEGPFTIDPGHLQTESDFVNFTRSRPDPESGR